MWNRNLLFVVSGPSGSGKTTLLKELLHDKDLKRIILRSISFTTRPKRPGEKSGKDYFFITEKKFKENLRDKKILEWTRFLNYYYGTLKSHFQRLIKKNRHIIFCLDEKGAFKIRRLFSRRVVTIFILPPKVDILKVRMTAPERRTLQEDLRKRLVLARRQLGLAKSYDYSIVNDDFNTAVKRLKQVIIKEINLRRLAV